MDDDKKWMQLQNAINLRSSEDQVTWTVFGIFSAATAILLVALFPNGQLPTNPVGMVITGAASALSFVWYKIQSRGLGHIKRYEALMEKLERGLAIDAGLAVTGKINKDDYEKYLGRGIKARSWMRATAMSITVLWAVAFFFFFVKLFCSS